jgi:hypothetical protein
MVRGDEMRKRVCALGALDALRAAGIEPSVNLKFFFEGGRHERRVKKIES